MPSGRTHDRITLWSLPAVTGLSLGLTTSPNITLWVAAGFLFGGLMLGPDLDIHSVHYKRWGWFRWIWLPYRGSMRHRSPLSHAPITGTVIRVLYLGAWVGFAALAGLTLVNEIFQMDWSWGDIGDVFWRSLRQYQYQALAVLVGLEIGAFSHYVADWLVSTRKRIKRYGWKAALPKQKRPSGKRSRKSTSQRGSSSKRSPKTQLKNDLPAPQRRPETPTLPDLSAPPLPPSADMPFSRRSPDAKPPHERL